MRDHAPLVRVALFITCFNDTLFPADGRAVVELLERLGTRSCSPRSRRAAGRCTSTPATQRRGAAAGAALRARVRRRRRGRLAVGVVRRASCASTSRGRSSASFELTEFLVDQLGVDDVGASFPHRVTLHPTCHSLRLLQRRRPAACGCCARCAGSTSSSSADARGVLRLRRDVRGQERRHLDGDAVGQAAPRARHARGGLHGGRQLLPDAHRRRAAAPARRACGRCTSPRSWRRTE